MAQRRRSLGVALVGTAPRTPAPLKKRKFGEVFDECLALVTLEGLEEERRLAEDVKREHLSVVAAVSGLRKTIAQLEDKGKDATIRSREAVESVEFGYQVEALESEIAYQREILADRASEVRARAELAAVLGESEQGLKLANARSLALAADLEKATSRVAALEEEIRAYESIVAAGAAAAAASAGGVVSTPQRPSGGSLVGVMSSQQRAPPSADKPRRTPVKAASAAKKAKTPTPVKPAPVSSAELQEVEQSCNALSAAANALIAAKSRAGVPAASILAVLEAEADADLPMQQLKAKVKESAAAAVQESTIVSTLYNLVGLDLVVIDRSRSTVKLV